MKSLMLFGLLFLANTGTAADLGTVRMNYSTESSKSIQLPDCLGRMDVFTNNLGVFGLSLFANDNCTKIIVNGRSIKPEIGTFSGIRKSLVPLHIFENGENAYDITIHSIGPHGNGIRDHVRLIVDTHGTRVPRIPTYPKTLTLRPGEGDILPGCAGRVEFNVVHGQGILVFRGVPLCSNFDIVSANGQSIDFPKQEIPGNFGIKGGSFPLPKLGGPSGSNVFSVIVKSEPKDSNVARAHLQLVF